MIKFSPLSAKYQLARTVGITLLGLIGFSTAQTSAAATYKFTIGAPHPTASTYVEAVDKFFIPAVVDGVKAATGDTVVFTTAYGGSVVKKEETIGAVQDGILDIGVTCFCFEPAKSFLNGFPYWVPFSSPDPRITTKAAREVYDQFPVLGKKLEDDFNQKLLAISNYDSFGLITKNKWDKLSDLKGLKIGAGGVNMSWLQGTGATGVSVIVTEGYNALLTGVFDAWLLYLTDYSSYKIYEVGKYFTEVNFSSPSVNGIMINLDRFNKLPEKIQEVLIQAGKIYEEKTAEFIVQRSADAANIAKEHGAHILPIAEDVREQWANNLVELPEKMALEGKERTGADAVAIVKAYIKAQENLGYKFPVTFVFAH